MSGELDRQKKIYNAATVCALAATTAAATTAVGVIASVVSSYDGRSQPSLSRSRRSCTTGQWHIIKDNPAFEVTWFADQLRCSKASLLQMTELVRPYWGKSHGRKEAFFRMKVFDVLALTLHYLAHSGNYQQSASMFGISKQAAIRLVRAMIHSLREMANIYIQLPEAEELSALERSFSDIAGFPGAVLAIDGSLIEIERPSDFEGWYCRKGYPAMNVQLVVELQKLLNKTTSCNILVIVSYSKYILV